MRAFFKQNLKKICSCFALVLVLALPFFTRAENAFADEAVASPFTDEVRSDEFFTMKMTATSRTNSSMQRVEEKILHEVAEGEEKEITYLCFQWRELSRLNFQFTFRKTEGITFGRYNFQVTHMGSEDLNTPFGTNDPEVLNSGDIAELAKNVSSSKFDFYYYIDSTAQISTNTVANGYGFGLYKFDFQYQRFVGTEEVETTFNLGEIYVAVIPDDIDQISPNTPVEITQTRTTGNGLITVYELRLSGDAFTYVNPARITWLVYGADTANRKYVLTKDMLDADVEYANYYVLWDTPCEDNGADFLLDTNKVEGVWNVECTIKNSDGTVKITRILEGLSTIKVEPKSYLWLILLIVGLFILLLIIIAFIISWRMKKSEKVW